MSLHPVVIRVADSSSVPFQRRREPVKVGVSYPRGVARPNDSWQLHDAAGAPVAGQFTPLDHWPDGTIRWLLVEFQADVRVPVSEYSLAPGNAEHPVNQAVTVADEGNAFVVSTGDATFRIAQSGYDIIEARVQNQPRFGGVASSATDAEGKRYQFRVRGGAVIHSGLLRATIKLDGAFVDAADRGWLDGTVRLHFFAGHSVIQAEFSVTNPRAAQHPGGTWDLGDAGSMLIRDLSIELRPQHTAAREVRASLDAGSGMTPAGPRFSVYQDSSGGANWQHINHANRDGRVTATFSGYHADYGDRRIEGARAAPIAVIGHNAEQFSIAVPRFWQLCPKKLTLDEQRCVLHMFPGDYGDVHELQGGERATLKFTVCVGPDTIAETPLAWVREPAVVSVNPDSYRAAGLWAPLTTGSAASIRQYETLVDRAIAGERTFVQRREIIDEFGWRNFGDLFADHEAVRTPLVSHYNNQYDALNGFINRFQCTGDPRWWELAADLALHVADIDTYHTQADRSAYSGGHFWHTQHYQPAGTATHRAYSKRSGSSGGGPSAEHNYTSGLMHHYFMTGDDRSRAVVLQLADWVINMDDGTKSIFRLVDRGDTGLASGTRSTDFHGPGRGAGNSINALLDAHRLTGDDRYLRKAEAIVARCVHPEDNVASLHLLDVENRWSYTVFLQSLGKYLDYRIEQGLVDGAFAFARAALLGFARWMAAHEHPYLDKPENLEFPTETWAAQDMRKAAVFEYAARYADDAELKQMFLARAGEFVDGSIAHLAASPTGHLTRPIVLLLAYALQRPRSEEPFAEDSRPLRWPPRVRFVAQRTRVKRRLIWTAAALAAAALSGAAFLAL